MPFSIRTKLSNIRVFPKTRRLFLIKKADVLGEREPSSITHFVVDVEKCHSARSTQFFTLQALSEHQQRRNFLISLFIHKPVC
jgi:hypothetical protein